MKHILSAPQGANSKPPRPQSGRGVQAAVGAPRGEGLQEASAISPNLLKGDGHKTFLLLILDGFGIDVDHEFNAITHANMPTWNALWAAYPHALLDASGIAVGLPPEQIGNSEVGHMTIGAGRLLYQDLTRIHQAIKNSNFPPKQLRFFQLPDCHVRPM